MVNHNPDILVLQGNDLLSFYNDSTCSTDIYLNNCFYLIKQDEYGWCESCGDEIGIKRLEARPTATHCIDCKTLDEIKEKQLSG